MGKDKKRSYKSEDLRKLAEKTLLQRSKRQHISPDNIENIIHELQVHQIELEMQNEELRSAQSALEESRNRYYDLYDFAPIGYFTLDEMGMIQEVNLAGAHLLGAQRRILVKMAFSFFISKEDFKEFHFYCKKAFKTNLQQTCELKMKKKDGVFFFAHLQCLATQDDKGKWSRLRVAVTDISELIKTEKEIKRTYTELNQIFNAAADAMCVISKEFKILKINNAFRSFLGISEDEAVGKSCGDILHDSFYRIPTCPVTRILNGEGSIEYDTKIECKDGRKVPCILTATPLCGPDGRLIGIVEHFKDITERKKMQNEMQKMEKLNSIGTLAGGIAHDFNNLLTAIVGNLSLLELSTKPEGNALEFLQAIKTGCQRATQLTKQLLTFSKGGAPIKKLSSISDLLVETTEFALRGTGICPKFCLAGNLYPVEIDEGQISQVINNLVINARQAMPKSGRIKIIVENTTISENDVLPVKNGRYIKISVKDQGVGIPQELLHNIFDPYFTTKQDGSGLGLSVCYSIIIQHGGYITVESEVSVGTTFTIFLPASEKENFRVEEIEEAKLCFGKGKILFMDDQESVREIAGRMLTHLGYEIEFAFDGAEAIEMYKMAKEGGKPFTAAIFDLTVPGGLGGKEAIQMLRQIDSDAKVIVSSGYSNAPIMSQYKEFGFNGVVAKPYEIKNLSETLYKVLNMRQ